MDNRMIIGLLLFVSLLIAYAWNAVPRLIRDAFARDYVPAYSWNVTDYKCTNWNGGIFNECVVSYKSPDTGETSQFTDWRFGRAPRDGVMLMQRRSNARAVTSDVSLQTVRNRILFGVLLLGFGLMILVGAAINVMRAPDGPDEDWTDRATRSVR